MTSIRSIQLKNRTHKSKRHSVKMLQILIGSIVLVSLIGGVTFSIMSFFQMQSHSACTVSDKDRTRDADGNSDVRIYTDNCGVFNINDSFFDGNFNSADLYSQVKVGETYDFTTRGFRIPFLSVFPNIIEVN